MSAYENYTSFGSYAPLYIEAKRAVARDRPVYLVLNAVADHADPLGLCYPGLRRLGDVTGYAVQTVKTALTRLYEIEYLRGHLESSLSGKQKYVFQLSPWVLYIKPEYIQRAVNLWERATEKRFDVNVINSVSNESQPESTKINQSQPDSNQTQTNNSFKQESFFPPSSSSSNVSPQLIEHLEFNLANRLNVTRPGRLIKKYGYYSVNGAFHHVIHQMENAEADVTNPAGLLIYLLTTENK